jgi:hypothetical protein
MSNFPDNRPSKPRVAGSTPAERAHQRRRLAAVVLADIEAKRAAKRAALHPLNRIIRALRAAGVTQEGLEAAFVWGDR